MWDLIFVAATLVAGAVCALYVRGCEKL